MALPGEEFFEPIRAGLKDLREGIVSYEDRQSKAAKQRLEQAELYRKLLEDEEKKEAKENLAETLRKSPMVLDREAAAAAARAGTTYEPFVVKQYDPNTWGKFRIDFARKFMDLSAQAADPNLPPEQKEAILKQQDFFATVGQGLGIYSQNRDTLNKRFNEWKRTLGSENADLLVTELNDTVNNDFMPILDELGYTDQQKNDLKKRIIQNVTEAGPLTQETFTSAFDAFRQDLGETAIEKIDQMYQIIGSSSYEELKEMLKKSPSRFWQSEIMNTMAARKAANLFERVTGTSVGNLYPSQVSKKMAEKEVRKRIEAVKTKRKLKLQEKEQGKQGQGLLPQTSPRGAVQPNRPSLIGTPTDVDLRPFPLFNR